MGKVIITCGKSHPMGRSIEDVYVVESLRTPFGKRNGALRNINAVDLLGNLALEILKKIPIEPDIVEDFMIGCVDQIGEQSANIARNAWLSAGLPEAVPAVTVDRQCGSSLQSIQFGASGIASGIYNFVLSGGVESMSRVPMYSSISGESSPMTVNLRKRYNIKDDWFSQARAASIIAEKYHIGRDEMDNLSFESHMRAKNNLENLRNEIVAVQGTDRNGEPFLMHDDEGVRPDTDIQKLNKLKDAFLGIKDITAGNSSQISDGASLTAICSDHVAEKYGLDKRAKLKSFTVAGVNPIEMLTGPITVTEKILNKENLAIEDIDYFEVNEAFAPVVLAWIKTTGADPGRVNVNGGAIALGHPLGATGSRLVGSMVRTLERKRAKTGLIAVCEGGGMANGVIIERME
ncbi:MAG: thiolase family protein [Cuniculiplasma sp.]